MKHYQEMQAFLAHPQFASLLRPRHGVLGPTLAPRSGRKQRDLVGATSSGAGRQLGRPSEPAQPTPLQRPAPDAGWGGLVAAPGPWDFTA